MLDTVSALRCCRCCCHCCPHRCQYTHLCARNCDDDGCVPPPPRQIEHVLWDDDAHGIHGDRGGHDSHVSHDDVYALWSDESEWDDAPRV